MFSQNQATKLSPLRGAGINHEVQLDKVDGKDPQIPWGPLYNMSRDKLLVLRKTLTEYLDKGFIRVSNSQISQGGDLSCAGPSDEPSLLR